MTNQRISALALTQQPTGPVCDLCGKSKEDHSGSSHCVQFRQNVLDELVGYKKPDRTGARWLTGFGPGHGEWCVPYHVDGVNRCPISSPTHDG